jgi:ABC-type glycerol-3-phosphate transport system substrate-binding protein
VVLAPGVGSSARPARDDTVTITLIANTLDQTVWQVLIANFERVYPNITVDATYTGGTAIGQLEPTELAAGNAPDLLATVPGCGTTTSVCELTAMDAAWKLGPS